MEEISPVKTISRKRKETPSTLANQFVGTLDRSKAQMCVHRNGSGCARPDVISEESSPVEDFSYLSGGNAWGASSIKDLRARRVFSPDVNSILEEQNEEKLVEAQESLNGLDSKSGQGRVFGTGSGYKKVDESENCDDVMRSEAEEIKLSNSDNGIHTKEKGAISGDASVFRSKMALNSCAKRKVFKAPGSFNYRRLLSYVMDPVNDDSVDAVIPCTSRESRSVKSNLKSHIPNHHKVRVEDQKSHPDNTKSSENKVMQNFQSGLPCNKEDTYDRNDDMNDIADNIGELKMEYRNSQDSMSQEDVSLEEKSIQMTPPDPDFFTEAGIGVNKENVVSGTFLTENQNCLKNHTCLNQSSCGKQLPNSINSLVLNPCSRRRVFKHPRSFSYRRLLPFLMEVSNDNAIQQQKPTVEFIEEPHPLSAASSVEQKYVKKLRTQSSHENQQAAARKEILLPAAIPPLVGSSRDTGANPSATTHASPFPIDPSNVKPTLLVSENGASPCMNLDLQTEGELQSQGSPRKLESKCPDTGPNGFNKNELSTLKIEQPEPAAKQSKCSDLGLEVYNDHRVSIEKVNLNEGALKMDVCDTLFSTIAGPPRGILKKNPRGCRGPCNCLNCASFHLHAERAFEFSKNQMHDAEEVALELMKELAKLRHLLAESITNENGPIAPLNLIQVKQACAKSLETEKLAKTRLSQLNCDLNIHCRIPALLQPKVTFSNYIQERAFPTVDHLLSLEKTEQ